MQGGWTEIDGEIMIKIARRILLKTTEIQQIPERYDDLKTRGGLGTRWPERAYTPSQTWAANLNL